MDSTRTNVHLGADTRPVFYQPTETCPMGAVRMGEVIVFPPYRWDEAAEFYRALMAVAAEAVRAIGADENCVRD